MDELAARRRKFFARAAFRSALFYSGDDAGRPSPGFQYFSGCAIDSSYLLLRPGSGAILTHEMNLRMAKAVSRYPVKLLGRDAAGDIRRAAGRGKIGFVFGEAAASQFLALKKRAKLRLVEADGKAFEARGGKSAGEVETIAKSAKIAKGILDGLDPWEFRTEQELASKLKIAALGAGADISFEPIVASGRNTSYPHHSPTGKKLGDAVLVDFGVRVKGYCSDFTRCYFRKKGTKEEKTYLECREVFEEILERLPECKKGRDVSRLSEKLMAKHGLPRLVHAIGHGVGLEVHEYPHLGKSSRDSLEGAVLAIEPAAYFKSFGVRFEGMVANTGKGWQKI